MGVGADGRLGACGSRSGRLCERNLGAGADVTVTTISESYYNLIPTEWTRMLFSEDLLGS